MELGLSRTQNGAAEITNANHPEIRVFRVPSHVAYAPAEVPGGSWKICSPQTAGENGGISATAYYFARRVQAEVNVPIGLVVDCLGGTPAESWTSPEALRTLKDFNLPLDEIARLHQKGGPEYGSFLMHWLDENDAGNNVWNAEKLDDHAWKPVTLPGNFSELVGAPSVSWFRREIVLPDPLPAGPAHLLLGVVEKMDTAYLNGQWVGASSWVENPRNYLVAEKLLHPGTNVIAIRDLKIKPDGGFAAKPEDFKLVLGDGKTSVSLTGEWRGMVSADIQPPKTLPLTYENYPTMPSVLYNGMLAPIAPLAIHGAIWYQGEANFTRAWQYRTLLPLMIADWRKLFGQGEFPFYIVSLPAPKKRPRGPSQD